MGVLPHFVFCCCQQVYNDSRRPTGRLRSKKKSRKWYLRLRNDLPNPQDQQQDQVGKTKRRSVGIHPTLVDQLRGFPAGNVCRGFVSRGDICLEQTGKDFGCLLAAYILVRMNHGSSEILTWLKVEERLLGLR